MSVRAGEVLVSASDGMNIQELKEKIASLKSEDTHKYPLIQDLIEPLDLVILVVPIDKAAPKGRLILPQQQTIRDILERGALSLVVRDTELKSTLDHFLAQGACRYRQSGICTCFKSCAGKHHPDFFFDSFFKI